MVADVIPIQRPRRRNANEPPLFQVMNEKEIREASKGNDDMLVNGLIPSEGFGVFYGHPKAFKSFLAVDLCYRVANARQWAGRTVRPGAAVYIAAEGASGIKKRVDAAAESLGTAEGKFFLVPASPNLGTARGDMNLLVASIESIGVAPALIVIDTLSQCLGGNDENGAGMIAFTRNALALAKRFKCFVLALHHPGLYNEDRPRGHTSLTGAADLQILVSRLPEGFATSLTVQKAKDLEDGFKLTARLKRHSFGESGSTLVVDHLEDGVDPRHERKAKAKIPASARLWEAAYRDVVKSNGDDAAKEASKFEQLHRERFYALNAGESESANRQAWRRGRQWLIENQKLEIAETGIALSRVA